MLGGVGINSDVCKLPEAHNGSDGAIHVPVIAWVWTKSVLCIGTKAGWPLWNAAEAAFQSEKDAAAHRHTNGNNKSRTE
jgi:hypothetical protein